MFGVDLRDVPSILVLYKRRYFHIDMPVHLISTFAEYFILQRHRVLVMRKTRQALYII
jgi:hypothetical protein